VVQLVDGVVGDAAREAALIAFCREHQAHFKCPRSVDFVDELPRLPTGKLYKGVLREQYWSAHDTRIV
jgi:acyl-CoA synthetase (AMP-forming)/AMP-acid ligase II